MEIAYYNPRIESYNYFSIVGFQLKVGRFYRQQLIAMKAQT